MGPAHLLEVVHGDSVITLRGANVRDELNQQDDLDIKTRSKQERAGPLVSVQNGREQSLQLHENGRHVEDIRRAWLCRIAVPGKEPL